MELKDLIALYDWNIKNKTHSKEELLNAWSKDPRIIPYIDPLKRAIEARERPYNQLKPMQRVNNPFIAKKTITEGYRALSQYIDAGIKLIPTKPNQEGNFYQLKQKDQLIKIDSWPSLKYWTSQGINRFIFIPKDAGLLCIDIDRGHKDGVNGVENFYTWLKNNQLDQMPFFSDIDKGSYPVYVTTPSGGIHIYFKCTGDIKTMATIAPGVEIKYNGLNITAGGSVKNGKPYSLHGNLRDIPNIPIPLFYKLSKILAQGPAIHQNTYKKTYKKGYTVDQLLNYARQDAQGGAHDIIFTMGRRLKKEGYTLDDAIRIIEDTPEHQGRKDKNDTYTCLKSIF